MKSLEEVADSVRLLYKSQQKVPDSFPPFHTPNISAFVQDSITAQVRPNLGIKLIKSNKTVDQKRSSVYLSPGHVGVQIIKILI